ncbi:hypothetical protein ABK040_015381 [Willaertia magna]
MFPANDEEEMYNELFSEDRLIFSSTKTNNFTDINNNQDINSSGNGKQKQLLFSDEELNNFLNDLESPNEVFTDALSPTTTTLSTLSTPTNLSIDNNFLSVTNLIETPQSPYSSSVNTPSSTMIAEENTIDVNINNNNTPYCTLPTNTLGFQVHNKNNTNEIREGFELNDNQKPTRYSVYVNDTIQINIPKDHKFNGSTLELRILLNNEITSLFNSELNLTTIYDKQKICLTSDNKEAETIHFKMKRENTSMRDRRKKAILENNISTDGCNRKIGFLQIVDKEGTVLLRSESFWCKSKTRKEFEVKSLNKRKTNNDYINGKCKKEKVMEEVNTSDKKYTTLINTGAGCGSVLDILHQARQERISRFVAEQEYFSSLEFNIDVLNSTDL